MMNKIKELKFIIMFSEQKFPQHMKTDAPQKNKIQSENKNLSKRDPDLNTLKPS